MWLLRFSILFSFSCVFQLIKDLNNYKRQKYLKQKLKTNHTHELLSFRKDAINILGVSCRILSFPIIYPRFTLLPRLAWLLLIPRLLLTVPLMMLPQSLPSAEIVPVKLFLFLALVDASLPRVRAVALVMIPAQRHVRWIKILLVAHKVRI